jgi:hypothetical protein
VPTPRWLLSLRHTGQSFLKDLGGDLHGADLAAAGTALLGQSGKPLPGRVAHGHLGVPHPARIGRPAWTATLSRHEAGLHVLDDSWRAVRHRKHHHRCWAPCRPLLRRDRRQSSRCFRPCSSTSVSCPSVAEASGLLPGFVGWAPPTAEFTWTKGFRSVGGAHPTTTTRGMTRAGRQVSAISTISNPATIPAGARRRPRRRPGGSWSGRGAG